MDYTSRSRIDAATLDKLTSAVVMGSITMRQAKALLALNDAAAIRRAMFYPQGPARTEKDLAALRIVAAHAH